MQRYLLCDVVQSVVRAPHLFDRFHRVRGARARTHEGSGIGLALAHELVGMHKGTVSVSSRPGRGTKFTVSIPRGSAWPHSQA